jgi:hypothetical protein
MLFKHFRDLFMCSVLQPQRSEAENLQAVLDPVFQAQEIVPTGQK